MKKNKTDYNVKIENPNSEGSVRSIIFTVKSSDIFDSEISKIIEVRFENRIDYDRIFEQRIIKKYTKENGTTNILDEKYIPMCKEIKTEEINSILSFATYNKKFLEAFKDYLVKINKSTLISEEVSNNLNQKDNKQVKNYNSQFNFEVYTDKKEDYSKSPISGFYSSQFKNQNKHEKVIKIKIDNEWKTLYYCIYYKKNNLIVIDSEMIMQMQEKEIQETIKFINRNKRNLEDLKLYLERRNLDLEQTKQY